MTVGELSTDADPHILRGRRSRRGNVLWLRAVADDRKLSFRLAVLGYRRGNAWSVEAGLWWLGGSSDDTARFGGWTVRLHRGRSDVARYRRFHQLRAWLGV